MKFFNELFLPRCTREFLQQVVKKYKEKEQSQSVVCLTCYKFDCLKHTTVSCRDFIINAHIRDIIKIANAFPVSQRSDLIEEALMAVTDVLTKHIEKVEYNKITSFIRTIAKFTMLNYLKYDKVVGPKTNKTVGVLSFDDVEDRSSGDMIDLLDTINKCCNTRYKRFIATCITEGGWTVQEMADALEISLAYAGRIKSELESEIWTKWYKGNGNGNGSSKGLCCLSQRVSG